MNAGKDKRLRLSITRLGLEFLGAMVLMGAFAVNTGNNLLYLLFSLMLGLFLVSGWVSRQAIRDLEWDGVEWGNLFARMRTGIRVRFRDRAPRRHRGLEVRLHMTGARVETAFLPGGGRNGAGDSVGVQVTPGRRGPCRFTALEITTSFPFGLLEKGWRFPMDEEALVLPHPLPGRAPAAEDGDLRVPRIREGGESPEGARPFREGDALGRIHWKRTAQRGEPWIRTFEDEDSRGLRLRLDLGAFAPGEAFEGELEALSGAVLQARLSRREVFLRVEGPSGTREWQGCGPCWRALALARASGGPGQGGPSALT